MKDRTKRKASLMQLLKLHHSNLLHRFKVSRNKRHLITVSRQTIIVKFNLAASRHVELEREKPASMWGDGSEDANANIGSSSSEIVLRIFPTGKQYLLKTFNYKPG